MKISVLGYVPPPSFPAAEVFLANVRQFKTACPLILYSDHPYPDTLRIKSPDGMTNRLNEAGEANKFAVNNLIFFTAVRIAISQGITHFIYLESDCRIGRDHWDGVILDEYFGRHEPLIVGGSMAIYNPCNGGAESARRWADAIGKNVRKNIPIPTYGWKGAADTTGSCVFVNGALGIYDVEWLKKMFDLEDTTKTARNATAWDMQIGLELWKMFGANAYDVVGNLNSVFSSYGNTLTSEEERLQMLRSGTVVGVHQVKSEATI